VDRLLELTRLEQTERLDEAKPHDINAIVTETVAALTSRADAAGVGVMVVLSPTPVIAMMDRELMKLAVSNVLENAIAFSSRGASVTVTTRAVDGRAEIVVEDSGAGVAANVLSKIGERFVSTERPNGAPKSSGLGLAIVKQVVELHRGEFSLVNATRGARAILRLPM
jgi:two-component system, OmpR family, sensor histidine kinase CreC